MQKIIIDGMAIYEVTKEIIDQVLENQTGIEEYGEPHHLLWYYDERSDKYIGCDNIHAHAWMEEFDTFEECLAWLLGKDNPVSELSMIYTSPRGKKIVFDDWVDNRKEYQSYWVEMCPHCHNKYRGILGKRADGGTACGTCSVKGCENEADYYVDFDEKEVAFKTL